MFYAITKSKSQKNMRSGVERDRDFHQWLFDAGLIILIVKNICDSSYLLHSRPDMLDNLMIIVYLGLAIWKMTTQHYKKWQLPVIVVVLLVAFISSKRMNYFFMAFTALSIVTLQDVDLKITMKKSSIVKAVLIGLHMAYYTVCLFVAPGSVTYSYRLEGGPRMTFFFGHANTFSMFFLWAIVEFFFAYYEVLNLKIVWGFYLLILVIHHFTDSNTLFMVGTGVVFLITYLKISKRKSHPLLRYSAASLFSFLSIFFSGICVFYMSLPGPLKSFVEWLNEALTGRLIFGAYAYDVKGMSIIGNPLYFPPKSYWKGHWFDDVIFDNGYIWLFVSYGVVVMIAMAIGFLSIVKKINDIEAVMIIAYCLYGVMENYFLNSVLCFSILFVGKYLFEEKEKKKGKKVSYVSKSKLYNTSL